MGWVGPGRIWGRSWPVCWMGGKRVCGCGCCSFCLFAVSSSCLCCWRFFLVWNSCEDSYFGKLYHQDDINWVNMLTEFIHNALNRNKNVEILEEQFGGSWPLNAKYTFLGHKVEGQSRNTLHQVHPLRKSSANQTGYLLYCKKCIWKLKYKIM